MRTAVCAALIATVGFVGCAEQSRDPEPIDSANVGSTVDTSTRLMKNLPAGRFQLPTQATPVPDLWITLPDGYRVKGASDSADDRFYVVHTDDPGLIDSNATTPGFMLVYVGRTQQRPFKDIVPVAGERVMVLGQPLQWSTAEDSLSKSERYFQRDIGSGDIFGQLSSELAREAMYLHIYVAGNDSARVAALMRSAESISIVP